MSAAPQSPPPTAIALQRDAIAAMQAAGVESPRLDVELLLADAWGIDRTRLYLRADEAVPASVVAEFHTMLQRRLAREPIQHILGVREFWSLEFRVSADVLVPRPETELLVERTVALINAMTERVEQRDTTWQPHLCDVGTGSGCVAIALATELPMVVIDACDISAAAIAMAEDNARRQGVDGRIQWHLTDLCSALPPTSCDALVSNPPYIPTADIAGLQPELAWEPRIALDGGADGLDAIRRLVDEAVRVLRPGGWLLVEFGAGQEERVCALFDPSGWSDVRLSRDLSGKPRVVEARRVCGEA